MDKQKSINQFSQIPAHPKTIITEAWYITNYWCFNNRYMYFEQVQKNLLQSGINNGK